ncbi:MAG TPA: hypothetical protein VNW90_12400 [Acetobacteraceae bacterium]|nr:hypothetical protein [Acetobacteraceae bacterium]
MSATLLLDDHAAPVAGDADHSAGPAIAALRSEPQPTGCPPSESSPAFVGLLENAEYLVRYAIEAHIAVDPELAARIIAARRKGDAAWADSKVGGLVDDITKLAALTQPVTGDTLRACREQAHDTIRGYKRIAIRLAAFIIPLSMISFIYTGISNCITGDVTTANQLAVVLHTQLGTIPSGSAGTVPPPPPASSMSDLQQFAATSRAIYSRTSQLKLFVPGMVRNTVGSDTAAGKPRFELDHNLPNEWEPMQKNLSELTATYQQVRAYAKAVQESTSVVYGAIGACILPVLYALLGACAYLLRVFSDQIAARTFAPTYATPARFVIAAIGGAIVGLFNNFSVGQTATLSPLAIAFLVGYAADIFFSFLEGSVQNFRKTKPG